MRTFYELYKQMYVSPDAEVIVIDIGEGVLGINTTIETDNGYPLEGSNLGGDNIGW